MQKMKEPNGHDGGNSAPIEESSTDRRKRKGRVDYARFIDDVTEMRRKGASRAVLHALVNAAKPNQSA